MSRLLEKIAAFTNLMEDGFDVNDASILVKLAEEEDEEEGDEKGRESFKRHTSNLQHLGNGYLGSAIGGTSLGALGTLAGYRKGSREARDYENFWKKVTGSKSPSEVSRMISKEHTNRYMKRLGAAGFLAGSLGGAVAGASLPVRDHEKVSALTNLVKAAAEDKERIHNALGQLSKRDLLKTRLKSYARSGAEGGVGALGGGTIGYRSFGPLGAAIGGTAAGGLGLIHGHNSSLHNSVRRIEEGRQGVGPDRGWNALVGTGVGALGVGALGTAAGYLEGRNRLKSQLNWIRELRVKTPKDVQRKKLKKTIPGFMGAWGGAGTAVGALAGTLTGAALPGRDHEKVSALANLLDNGYSFDDAIGLVKMASSISKNN